jgi:cyclic pyranopterin phosphate synthase
LSNQLEPLLQAITLGRSDPQDPLARLQEVALTSNGVLLTRERALALRQLGLDRITLSLDAAGSEGFVRMAGMPDTAAHLFERVLSGLDAALAAGFDPSRGALKINSVIQRHHNDDQLIPLARLARRYGIELRLIEFMDVGHRNDWHQDQVLTASEMLARLREHWSIQPIGRAVGSTANRWRFSDGKGQVATIASISEPFCGDCNRLRVAADGMAFTCLFATQGKDLRPWLQPLIDEDGLMNAIRDLWIVREDRYSEERGCSSHGQRRQEMAYLGG